MSRLNESRTGFALNPELDVAKLAERFRTCGRIHIPDFLAKEGAEAFLRSLKEREDWSLIVNQEDKSFDLDRRAQAALTAGQREALDKAVFAGARYGFQYRYESIRVPDGETERAAMDDPLARFASFLSSPEVVDLLRRITDKPGIAFADAQATAYGPGHFLTAHDDEVAGKKRLAAYVMNLTPSWRVDWGGLLLFHGSDGHVEHGFTPSFNALNIFAVPQPHSVSMVAPFAPYRRYSVTGWLRAK
jgi:Rps23 Pro-64 3,4-dihydroxylase Tpa1-like proline 4-hydroxylase